MDETQLWWRDYPLEINELRQWEIGPLSLAVRRLDQEWQIYYDDNQQRNENDSEDNPSLALNTEPAAARGRYVVSKTTPGCSLVPALADRAVITRPAIPFYVLPGQQLTLFVSTPLWVSVQAGVECLPLLDLPVLQPSDTWFGPSTREGDLCYAIHTNARIDHAALPHRSYRAITPVVVSNRAPSALLLDRLKLPVPFLALYGADNDYLWTQAMVMTRNSESGQDFLEIQDGPPSQCPGAQPIAPPRQKPDRKTLGSTLSMLFG